MSLTTTSSRTASTTAPILGVLAERWSPRAFDSSVDLDESALLAALEAARWSPSASNSQPWRFLVARRGTEEFRQVAATLVASNAVWAEAAGALVVALTEVVDQNGAVRRWAEYDLGQAMAYFTVQAHAGGLHVHQMGGFDPDALRSSFTLPENYAPVTVSAVGTVGHPDILAEKTRAREIAPRSRKSLDDVLISLS